MGFDRMPKNDARSAAGVAAVATADAEEDTEADGKAQGASYEYLLSMAISSLTQEKVWRACAPSVPRSHVLPSGTSRKDDNRLAL